MIVERSLSRLQQSRKAPSSGNPICHHVIDSRVQTPARAAQVYPNPGGGGGEGEERGLLGTRSQLTPPGLGEQNASRKGLSGRQLSAVPDTHKVRGPRGWKN